MALTPLEIRKKAFSKVFRGYSTKEVRAFLAVVANEFEELRKERAALAEKVDHLTNRVNAFEKTEHLLRETLLTAQKVAEEMKTTAEKERQLLIEQAKQEIAQLQSELKELTGRRALILDEIRAIANTYLAIIDRFEKEQHERTEANEKRTTEAKNSRERSGNKE